MQVEVNAEKIIGEMSELIGLAIKTYGSFSKKFPELYWKVYIPAKTRGDSS